MRGGGTREEEEKKKCSDVDGTSTKYEAHQSTTSWMLTSSTTPPRDASKV